MKCIISWAQDQSFICENKQFVHTMSASTTLSMFSLKSTVKSTLFASVIQKLSISKPARVKTEEEEQFVRQRPHTLMCQFVCVPQARTQGSQASMPVSGVCLPHGHSLLSALL